MKNKIKNKKIAIYIALFIILLGGSFIVYNVIKADNNSVEFKTFTLSQIETGIERNSFSNDGHDYTANNSNELSSTVIVSGYEGKDATSDNSIVRTYDKIAYHFNYDLYDEAGNEFYDESSLVVRIRATFDNSISEYVAIEDSNCTKESETSYVCAFYNKELLDNSSSYEDVINVKILNAPSGTIIDPRFEATIDNSVNYINSGIVLGNNGSSHAYEFKNNAYDAEFRGVNPMPTVVTATNGTYSYEIKNAPTQLATVEGENGRLITYVLGIRLNNSDGIVGKYYNLSDINLNVTFSQDNNLAKSYPEWIRLYDNQTVDGINAVTVGAPYSSSVVGDFAKYIRNPGVLSVSGSNDSFDLNLSGYNLSNDNPTICANGEGIDNNSPYIATIAITNFSGRSLEDGKNDIVNNISITGSGNITSSIVNKYEISGTDSIGNGNNRDYTLSSAFYDQSGINPYAIRLGGSGAVPKGTTTLFKTIFNYHKANSDQGLKEIIKFDTNAFRVMPLGIGDQVSIEVLCDDKPCEGISKDDFEVKFVTGDFNPNNYTVANSFADLNLNSVETEVASTNCASINLSNLNSDQVQNLYGGPCIKANAGVEQVFDSIYDATNGDEENPIEIPISKVIVQTKSGVTLPDNSKVVIGVEARVRNVSDITRNYQATAIASSSDYDNELIYYIPRGDLNGPNVTDPNNYQKNSYVYTRVTTTFDYIGDDLKIVNFSARQNLSVTNTNSDGTTKVNYRTTDNETIEYLLQTNITDYSVDAGADDVWFINHLRIGVLIPKELVYIPDSDLGNPEVIHNADGSTGLVYTLPYTKPNMNLPFIKFKTKLDPKLKGETKNIVVKTDCYAININGEIDTSQIGATGTSFTIYGTGISEIIGEMKVGDAGTVVEKDTEFSYILNAYNNTGAAVDDYSLIDVLPYTDKGGANSEERGSNFSGKYDVKIITSGISESKIKCSKADPNTISKHVGDTNNEENGIWEECGEALYSYVSGITAFKIDDLTIAADSYMDNDIVVYLKPSDNKYSNKYANNFIGKTERTSENISNTITVSVVNRNISGSVFVDTSGMGVKDGNETYLENVPITLYKVASNGALENKGETVTDKEGKYKFENLDTGRYKIRSNYNTGVYDLTLRYATEDRAKDSDAYKVNDDGTIEISDKSEKSKGILLSRTVTTQDNMDIGLLPRSLFGFSMKKYITRIDLTNSGVQNTTNYNNESSVSISVLNPNRFYAKVYYGISLTNNSSKAGIIDLVKEDIPNGMIFDRTLEENSDWFEADGMVQTTALKDIIIKPGETKYLQIVLLLPERNEAGTFINTASVAEMREYDPQLTDDLAYENNSNYTIGDSLSFAGVNWHVVNTRNSGGEQILTLLADSGTITQKLAHNATPYKWSESFINSEINDFYTELTVGTGETNLSWIRNTNLNTSILIDDPVCDDASALPNGTNGGKVNSLNSNGCISGIYTTSKVRLLTVEEYEIVKSANLSDESWLYGNNDYWLMNSIDSELAHNVYGVNTNADVTNLAAYVNHSSAQVATKASTSNLEVRPVIEISTYNIIPE